MLPELSLPLQYTGEQRVLGTNPMWVCCVPTLNMGYGQAKLLKPHLLTCAKSCLHHTATTSITITTTICFFSATDAG